MIILRLVLVVLTTSACTVSRPATVAGAADAVRESGRIVRTQLMVGGGSLGDHEAAIQHAFGQPLRINEVVDGITNEPAKELYFAGVEVYLHKDEVYNLKCTTPVYTTPDGARVGQRVEDVVNIYGPGETFEGDGETLLRYNVTGTDTYLLFHVRNDSVVMIELWFDYT